MQFGGPTIEAEEVELRNANETQELWIHASCVKKKWKTHTRLL